MKHIHRKNELGLAFLVPRAGGYRYCTTRPPHRGPKHVIWAVWDCSTLDLQLRSNFVLSNGYSFKNSTLALSIAKHLHLPKLYSNCDIGFMWASINKLTSRTITILSLINLKNNNNMYNIK